jgi:DNA-binding NtrC family response regulator
MTKKNSLNIKSDYFRLISKAVFTNPFGKKRKEILKKILGDKVKKGEDLQEMLSTSVNEHIGIIETKGNANFQLYVDKEREWIRIALLYDVYQKFKNDFDTLIIEQIKNTEKTSPVTFAPDALALLKNRGCSAEEASLYFAFFYQLRRAWHFINNGLIGQSPCMEALRCRLWNNIFTRNPLWYEKFLWNRMEDFSTILVGETGTGKGSAAAAIGRSGFIPFDERKERFVESFTSNFIEINLSQFSESLIESELFGHEKGAFTGAVDTHEGVFSRSSPHGGILLDEIGDISIPVQIKLLKVLEERMFSAVGSHKKQRFEGRVIAATNKSLKELRQQGKFRDDFYYRLCSDVIAVPPLSQQIREHSGTLEELLDYTIQQITGEPAPDLIQSVKNILNKKIGTDYPWPGNVRELVQAVRQIILTQEYSGDQDDKFSDPQHDLYKGIEKGKLNAQEILNSYCALLYQRHGTYEEVARITKLDRRTVKKYIHFSKGN